MDLPTLGRRAASHRGPLAHHYLAQADPQLLQQAKWRPCPSTGCWWPLWCTHVCAGEQGQVSRSTAEQQIPALRGCLFPRHVPRPSGPKEPELCRGWLLDHSPISKHMGDGVGITTTDCLTQEPTPPEVGLLTADTRQLCCEFSKNTETCTNTRKSEH